MLKTRIQINTITERMCIYMKQSLRKKISAALLVGCTTLVLGSTAFAAPNNNQLPPPKPNQTMVAPPPHINIDKFKDYNQQFQQEYSWMYTKTRHEAANTFVQIDEAVDNNKISETQANKLKKKMISFYKDQQKALDEMRKLEKPEAAQYRRENRDDLSLHANFASLSESTTIPVSTLKEILRPMPPKHPNKVKPSKDNLDQRLRDFTNKLIQEGKISQQEVDSIGDFIQSGHDKFKQMDKAQRDELMNQYRNMTDAERLKQFSDGTGIPVERLQEIFNIFKTEMNNKLSQTSPE